ncbi:MAG TPA: helix-turn-helix domain-containing protein [Solirubrobacteraceae bacterium]|nr:helix-turn-helix domain-containing protein [Solirubrobacteraceae bacterium]
MGDETGRLRLEPAERRRLLLDAAADLFTRRPYAAVSMADVARAAGVSKPLVFRYFGDKRSLFVASLQRVVAQLADAADADPALPAPERFRRALHGYLDVIERYPQALSSFDNGEAGRDAEVRAIVDGVNERLAERIVARLGVQDPPVRLSRAVRTWLAFVRTSTLEWLERDELARDQLVALQIATFRASVAEALGLEMTVSPGPAAGLRLP